MGTCSDNGLHMNATSYLRFKADRCGRNEPFGNEPGASEGSASSGPAPLAPAVVIEKAADLCGGPSNLAYVLESTTEDVCNWITGAVPAPDRTVREALTVISCIRK